VTTDGRYVFVTNFGDGSISSSAIGADGSLSLVEAVAGSTVRGRRACETRL
jgi:6-phosphogluconolactonase (cycloisomerase 2 family)